jgi:Glycosyl hydrolase family 26
MHRRRTSVTAVIGAALVVAFTATAAVPVTASRDSRAGRQAAARVANDRSGLPWASGVHIPWGVPADYEAFGAWRGAPPDIALLYGARETWDQIVKPTWLPNWNKTAFTLVISTGMLPADGGTLAECADGDFDARWRRYGREIADAGVASRTIIRLGWEFNGLWVPWAAKNPAHYAQCWRRIHRSVEIAAPQVRWDWCVNRSKSSVGIDPRLAYPGDKYVDIVGIDSFDGYPPATTEAGWTTQHSGEYGLEFWAGFAREHRKGLSVPEWAIYPGTSWAGAGGGDNPDYIARMFGFFRQNADILAYETYFNEPDPYQGGALNRNLNPLSSQEYRGQIARMRWRDCEECARPLG